MKNSMMDLHNHLFAQLERLSDESVKDEELRDEIGRSKAVIGVADILIANASLMLEAEKLRNQNTLNDISVPKILDSRSE